MALRTVEPRTPTDELEAVFETAKKRPRALADTYDDAGALNTTQQMDLLFLPTDPDQSKYALVVVDIATRRVATLSGP